MKDFKLKGNWKEVLVLGVLLILGLIIFFLRLKSVPLGFYVDEALHGYNSYSILLTGKDEYGKFLPIVFRFYGSYNAPLYVYLTTIPIKIFGLNPYSVRFIAALSGFLSIFVFYFFLKKLKISRVASLFFATVPWLIFQSRIGYEVSLAFFLFSLGSLFLWLSLKNKNYIIPSFLSLSLSTYAAYAERFIVPALLLLFFIVFRKKILKKENYNVLKFAFIFLFLTQIPNLVILSTYAFFPKSDLIASSTIFSQAQKLTSIFPQFLAYALAFIREFTSQYVNYFSPRSLFLASDLDMPEIPPLYQWMILPYIVGAIYLWKRRKEDYSKFIFLLALLAPIPAALTKDPFSARRGMPELLPISLIIAFGIGEIIKFFSRFKIGLLIGSLLAVVVFAFSLVFFWRSYFVLFVNEKAKDFSFGFEALASETKSHPQTHYLIDDARIKLPYMELAFWMKIRPDEFQKSVDGSIKEHYYENTAFDPHHKFANIETRSIIWEKDIYQEQVLVGDELSISPQQAKEHFLTKVFEIKDPQERIIFQGFQTNPLLKCKVSYTDLYCRKYK